MSSRGFAPFGSSGAPLLQQIWDFFWKPSKSPPYSQPREGSHLTAQAQGESQELCFAPGILLFRAKALEWGQEGQGPSATPWARCRCCSRDGISGIQPLSAGHQPTPAK